MQKLTNLIKNKSAANLSAPIRSSFNVHDVKRRGMITRKKLVRKFSILHRFSNFLSIFHFFRFFLSKFLRFFFLKISPFSIIIRLFLLFFFRFFFNNCTKCFRVAYCRKFCPSNFCPIFCLIRYFSSAVLSAVSYSRDSFISAVKNKFQLTF